MQESITPTRHGHEWLWPDGTRLPVVAGAADADPPPEGTTTTPAEGNLDDLPAWARDAISKANKEAAGYRTKVRELEPLANKAKEQEEAAKSETERLNERIAAAEQRAQEAEQRATRLEVAIGKALPESDARRITTAAKRLVGSTKEELEADADDLLSSFTATTPGDDGDERRPASRPTERLRGGGDPTETEPVELDPKKLAEAVPRF